MARHFESRTKKDNRRHAAAQTRALPPMGHADASPGELLDAGARAALEPRFGHDFSNVRVHADAEAAAAAGALDANAFAVGSDLFFAEGAYDTETPDGMHLLAHELTHVAQSRGQDAPASAATSTRSDASEVEARQAADHVVAGNPVPSISAAPAAISMEEKEGHGHAGWMDRLFGLNPDKSFVESGMEGLGYGKDGIWGRPRGEDEGDLSMAARGLGAAAVSPLTVFPAIGGHALDEINHGPLMFHGLFDK